MAMEGTRKTIMDQTLTARARPGKKMIKKIQPPTIWL
jgi:hypothetical protein